jgi:RecA-family ATPase
MPTPAPRRYLVEGIVPESYPTMIYGDGGVAKSMLALSLGLGVASDAGTWLGHKIEPGGVLYLDFELDAAEQNRRVSRLVNAEGLDKPPSLLRYMSAVGVRARDAFEDAFAECKEHDVRLS